MKEYLWEHIYGEYQAYKSSVLGMTNAEIFARCYEIDTMTNLCDILTEKIEGLDNTVVQKLLDCKNILAILYDRWLGKPGSSYADLEEHIEEEIGNIVAESEGSERSAA
jgi:hypothetical protein